MRFLFLLPLCLTLAACSSDPAAPIDSGLPPADIATEIAPWIDSGVPVDVGDDRAALPDFGPRDVGADVPADVTVDRPAPMDVAEVPPDTGCTELFCGGRCVDNSAMNCGACGVVCTATLPHTRPGCVERGGTSVCAWGCEVGWGNCDRDDSNGCEYSLFGVDSGFCPRR